MSDPPIGAAAAAAAAAATGTVPRTSGATGGGPSDSFNFGDRTGGEEHRRIREHDRDRDRDPSATPTRGAGVTAFSDDQFRRLLEHIGAAARPAAPRADKKLTPFSTGDGTDWIAWRRTFEAVRALNHWSPDMARGQLVAGMEGAACRMVADIVTDHLTCGEILKRYGDRFLPPAQSRLARQLFKDASQNANESITAWHTRVRELYSRAHPEGDLERAVELVERFLLGLAHSKVRELSYAKLPETMAQALTEASNAAATVACLKNNDGFGGRPSLHAIGDKSRVRCFNCNEFGHMRRDCKKPVRKKEGTNPRIAKRKINPRGGRKPGEGDKSKSALAIQAISDLSDTLKELMSEEEGEEETSTEEVEDEPSEN